MIGLITAASSVLGTLGGGGNPLGSIAGEEGGAVTSTATSGPATAGGGSMSVGGKAETPWLLIAGAIVAAAYILKRL